MARRVTPRIDPLLTASEAAAQLGLSVDAGQIRQWIRAGRLPATRAGARLWLIRQSDLTAFDKSREVAGVRPNRELPTFGVFWKIPRKIGSGLLHELPISV